MKGMKPLKGQMGGLLKQAQQMQMRMAQVQEEIAKLEIETSSGGGAVTVKINGQMELLALKIDPNIVDPGDVETLEDLVLVAVNQAIEAVRAKSTEMMAAVTGGLPGMPF
jgi:DNA-binding YbaB/EbfC family protein